MKAQDPAEMELVVDGVSRSMDRVKEREIANMKRGLSALATISSSAPFVGLFGTVFGIITAFQNMADPSKGGGGLATVSAGISEALLTTAVGLAVAIVSVWFYNYFITRVDELTIDVDETSGEILDTMMRDSRS
jgi:biopolymer transport protein ExbB/TolQ